MLGEQLPSRKGRGHFNLGFFIIDRKTDIAAFVALLISLFNLSIAGWWLLKGPEPILRHPYAVTFLSFRHTNNVTDPDYLKMATDMLYLNKGEKGQDAILIRENLTVWIEGSSVYTVKNPIKMLSNKYEIHLTSAGKLTRDSIKDAYPITIPGRDVASHYTLFESYPIDCNTVIEKQDCNTRKNYIKISNFTKELRNNLSKEGVDEKKYASVMVKVSADYLDQAASSVICEIRFQEYGITYLESEKRPIMKNGSNEAESSGWMAQTCYPVI